MLIEISGICQYCATEIKVLMLNNETLDSCTSCGKRPVTTRKIQGLIYVVTNPNQTGVKIGLTTKPMEQRLKSLSSTGVPGEFSPIVIFPSERPKFDEKKVHEKLLKHRLSKEHFDLEPIEAALKTYRALNKRRPIFFDIDIERTFHLKLEQAKIEMQLRLRGA